MSIHYKPTLGRGTTTDASGKVSINEVAKRLQLELGVFIKEKREALGLTQRVLAKLVNVTDNHISDIENGHRKLSPERYLQMAEALGLDRVAFGKRVLLHYDPYTYKVIFGGNEIDRILDSVPDRISGWQVG